MKAKLIESVEATRSFFKEKGCTPVEYFQQFESEMRYRGLHKGADELHALLKERISKGGFV